MTDEKFMELVVQYEKLVYTICYQLTRDSYTAEDLTQETFLSAYTHRDSCRDDNLKPWLARIATNKAKDHLKSAYQRRVNPDAGEAGLQAVSNEPLPERVVETGDELKRIRQKVDSLKEPYALVCQMYFYDGKSTDEIAAALGRPKKTVETQLYRAKRKLQEMIKEGW